MRVEERNGAQRLGIDSPALAATAEEFVEELRDLIRRARYQSVALAALQRFLDSFNESDRKVVLQMMRDIAAAGQVEAVEKHARLVLSTERAARIADLESHTLGVLARVQ